MAQLMRLLSFSVRNVSFVTSRQVPLLMLWTAPAQCRGIKPGTSS